MTMRVPFMSLTPGPDAPVVAMPVLDLLLIGGFHGIDVPGHESRESLLKLNRPGAVLEIHLSGLSSLE
jgi:hypothetical protein